MCERADSAEMRSRFAVAVLVAVLWSGLPVRASGSEPAVLLATAASGAGAQELQPWWRNQPLLGLTRRGLLVEGGDAHLKGGSAAAAKSLLPALQPPREESYERMAKSFHRSTDLGVSRCSLLGLVGEEDVTLHVWLRMAPPSVVAPKLCRQPGTDQLKCKRTAHVRGFALLQSVRLSIPSSGRSTGVYLLQAGSIKLFSKDIYLRSYTTHRDYHLNMTLARSKRERPWNASNPSEGWTNHVMDLTGELVLMPEDVEQSDFELRAVGFDWHCHVLVEGPVLGYRSADRGPYKYPAGSQASADSIEDAAAAGSASEQLAGRGRTAQPPWHFHTSSSLSPRTQVWQLLSPFYRMSTHNYAVMLWHRVLWHSQMGIHKSLLYVYESLSPLMKEPLIQNLVFEGYLEVVFFTEMPKHEREPFRPSHVDVYTLQVIAYNHALLALWGSDTLVLVADVDEFLMTHRPMTAVEAYSECRNRTHLSKPAAGLQVRRTDAVCAPEARKNQCDPTVPGLMAWSSTSLPDVRSGATSHPLSWHAMTAGGDLWGHHNTKTIVDPNLVRDMHVHFFMGSPNAKRDTASTSCMRLLHLVDLYRVRHSSHVPSVAYDSATSGNKGWWWPAQHISADGPGPQLGAPPEIVAWAGVQRTHTRRQQRLKRRFLW